MKKPNIYFFIVLLSFLSMPLVLADVIIDTPPPVDNGVTIEIPIDLFDNNTAFVNLSMDALGWLTTNQGRLTSTAQILYNLLDGIPWIGSGNDVFNDTLGVQVGIGTSTPQNALNVVGTGNFSGDVFAQSFIVTNESSIFFGNDTLNFTAKMFANSLTIANETRTSVNIDSDFGVNHNFNGTSFLGIFNLNDSVFASAAVTAVNHLGKSLTLFQPSINLLNGTSFLLSTGTDFKFLNQQNVSRFGFLTTEVVDQLATKTAFTEQFFPFSIFRDFVEVNSSLNVSGITFLGDNTTIDGFLFLNQVEDISPSTSTLVRRDDATGVLGIIGGSLVVTNLLDEATSISGVNYVWDLGSDNNLTIDLHSSNDTNSPLLAVSHYNNQIKGHIWVLDPSNNDSFFQWESGANNALFTINSTGLINLNDSIIISPNGNITFPELINCDTIDSNENGTLFCGDDETGGGGGGTFGSEFEKFESLGQSNTASSLVDKLDVTTALKPAGTYRVGFTVDATNSDGTDLYDIQFLVDNVPIHQHINGADLYTNKPNGNNDWEVYSTFHYITLGSSATIDLNIKFGTNDNTARVSNAVIEIWRVS